MYVCIYRLNVSLRGKRFSELFAFFTVEKLVFNFDPKVQGKRSHDSSGYAQKNPCIATQAG